MANVGPLVIQYLMKNRAVTERELKIFINEINRDNIEIEINALLEKIKSILDNFNLTVKVTRCELTGLKYFVLISSVIRDCLEEYPLLTKDENDCLYTLINCILNNDCEPLGSNNAINMLCDMEKSIGLDEATDLLKKFVTQRLLVTNNDGYYFIGPLALTELASYLFRNPNAKTCKLCAKNVIYSKYCNMCESDVHYYCFQAANLNNSSQDCPVCED